MFHTNISHTRISLLISLYTKPHVFHNTKRSTIGLQQTRSREFLLNIDFSERETFAYACETYSRVLELSDCAADREKLAAEVCETFVPPDDRVDIQKFRAAVSAAGAAKNGWKKILEVCEPAKSDRQAAFQI